MAHGRIWNVRIDQPVQHPYTSNPHAVIPPVKEILGSRLEVVDIAGGYRKIGREIAAHLEQLTFDEYHNSHPRISPDGKWMAFISFPPDIDPNTPPLYQKAMIRLLPLMTPGAPHVLAYLYGGQESLNTPTWTPDSRFIFFISNSMVIDHP